MPGLMVSGWQPPALAAAINLRKEPSRLQPPHREGLSRVLAVLRGHSGGGGTAQGGYGGVTHSVPRMRGAGMAPALHSAAGLRQEPESSAGPGPVRGRA